MFSNSFILELLKYRNISLLIKNINFISIFLSIYLILITPHGINKLSISLIGLLNSISGISISKIDSTLENRLNDLQITSRLSSKNLLDDYLKNRDNLQIEIMKKSIEEKDIITDPVNYWISQQKHLLIIGATNSGKSFTLKLFQNELLKLNYQIKSYDIDATFEDYSKRVNVIYDYPDIEKNVEKDLNELELRVQERRIKGKNYNPQKTLIVSEELPSLVDEIELMQSWIKRLSNRGRKVGLFIAALSQNDTVDSLGLSGNSKLINNFVRIYLGERAKERAKLLKNDALIKFLNTTSKGYGLIDDIPCIINPQYLFSTSYIITNDELSETSKIAKSTEKSGVLEPKVENSNTKNDDILGKLSDKSENELIEIGKIFKSEGYSKTKIIKLLFNVEGGKRFTELSRKLDE